METYSTKFSDYQNDPQKLVGKLVVRTISGLTNSSSSIKKITKATKTQFEIEGTETKFRTDNGSAKVKSTGRMGWGNHDDCTLITPEEAERLQKKWNLNKLKRELHDKILVGLKDIKTISLEQIQNICVILNIPTE
jgi:hypothetical protein